MILRNAVLTLSLLALGACGASEPRIPGRFAEVDGVSVRWKDFEKLGSTTFDGIPLGEGENVYLVTGFTDASVTLENGDVVSSYSDCLRASSTYTAEYPILDNDKFDECYMRVERAKSNVNQRSLPELIALTESAVKQEGSCVWGGYDRTFDLTVRAVTRSARFDDEGLFFARMTCMGAEP